MSELPVFYDRSGKRLYRLVLITFGMLSILGGVLALAIPAALAPTRSVGNQDNGFPRRFLTQDVADMPIIGDTRDPLTRVVKVVQQHTGSGAPPGPESEWVNPGWWGWWSDAAVEPQPPAMPVMQLVDPASGAYLRDATEEEVAGIGTSPYATEHFGAPPDKTMMLTFDDGPDPVWTRQLLDLLSREHVPATFFVVGEQVVKNADLFQRIIREGHMAANHTMTHIDFDSHTDWRNREEIISTDRVMRALAGYDTRLFRMPYGDPDNNPLGTLQGQQLGQIHVGYTIDTDDWKYKPGEQIPVPPLDGKGQVVLAHDAGGNRAGTLVMVEKLIRQAKAQGYVFKTLAPILPKVDVPQHGVTPSLADRATLAALQSAWVLPAKMLGFVFWFGVGSMVVLTAFYLVLSVWNERRQRRRVWPEDAEKPFVSVVLAAYNEEAVIARTLAVLRESDYPADRFEVVAVNDGSTDHTLQILLDAASGWERVKVINQANSGKSSALNNGINHADPRSSVIITMDADTLFRAATIGYLARHFTDERVGAVAGHVKVGNRRNLLTAWQSLEYLNGICIIRMAEMMVGAVGIVPGACSAWRRSALERIGGFSEDTLAEDADAAMTFQRLGYKVLHENHALCDTEAPETMVPLLKQRKRWMFGNLQVMWKNRAMLFRPKYGLLGMLTMPYSVAQLLLNLLFLPVLLVVAAVNLASGDWHSVVVFALVVLVMHTVIAITAIAIAREKLWHLLVVPFYRPIYEVMRVYLLYATAYRIAKGAEVAWDKLERRNSVVAQEGEYEGPNDNDRTAGRQRRLRVA